MSKLIYLLPLFVFVHQIGFAQDKAQEAEDLQKELKVYYRNLQKFQQFKQQNTLLDTQIQSKQEYIAQLKTMFDAYADRTEIAVPQLESLKNQHRYWKRQAKRNQAGVFFKVQVATLKDLKIDSFQGRNTSLVIESDGNGEGKKRYLVGNFKSYKEAKRFSDFLHRREGLDCYVVGYEKGKRLGSLSGYMD